MLQGLSPVMTAPTFASFTTILTGWVMARRRTITGMILAAGEGAVKHFSSYHRLFSAAQWSLDLMGCAVFRLFEADLGGVEIEGLSPFGIKTYIPEPQSKYEREWTDKPASYKLAVYNNRKCCSRDHGKALHRRRKPG